MSRVTSGLAAVLVLCLTVPACSSDPSQWMSSTGDDPVIFTHTGGTTGMAALTGQIAYDSMSKCLVLKTGEGIHIPIWPPGTEPIFENGRRGVTAKGAGVLMEGDTVTLGGNGAEEELLPSTADVQRCARIQGRGRFIVAGQVTRG
jgi:hypothetical protein